jgi:glutathione S-transferase
MKLYGTVTSPFVRRVRVVAAELGEPVDLVDTATDAGQAELRAVTPIWKVPAAEIDGVLVFDSRVICDVLLARGSATELRPMAARGVRFVDEMNVLNAIDEALLSAIRLFYLQRDGADLSVAYLVKERARVESTLTWLEGRVRGPWLTDIDGFGVAELALFTTLAWMRFRNAVPLDAYPKLHVFETAHQSRPSLLATAPT